MYKKAYILSFILLASCSNFKGSFVLIDDYEGTDAATLTLIEGTSVTHLQAYKYNQEDKCYESVSYEKLTSKNIFSSEKEIVDFKLKPNAMYILDEISESRNYVYSTSFIPEPGKKLLYSSRVFYELDSQVNLSNYDSINFNELKVVKGWNINNRCRNFLGWLK